MLKATWKPKAERVMLTFRGSDCCDGCGGSLKPGDRLWGLCPACQGGKARPHVASASASDSVPGRR
jgi:hypothetical protein